MAVYKSILIKIPQQLKLSLFQYNTVIHYSCRYNCSTLCTVNCTRYLYYWTQFFPGQSSLPTRMTTHFQKDCNNIIIQYLRYSRETDVAFGRLESSWRTNNVRYTHKDTDADTHTQAHTYTHAYTHKHSLTLHTLTGITHTHAYLYECRK